LITLQVKTIFDTAKVRAAVGKVRRKNLSRAGAFVMRRARSSIRKRKVVSKPGQPPSSHLGLLRKGILFAYDLATRSVVVGATKLNMVFFDRDRKPVRGTVPQVLEEGGAITIFEVQRHGKWRRADLRTKRRWGGLKTRYRTAQIAARPFMQPAHDAELKAGTIPKVWADSVKP
jgi:hypothetical protein